MKTVSISLKLQTLHPQIRLVWGFEKQTHPKKPRILALLDPLVNQL
jgi:hypothetical protein